MNQQMRRYLEEDWDDDTYVTKMPVRSRADDKQPQGKAQTRRQTEKLRGREISKFLRSIDKQRQYGKP